MLEHSRFYQVGVGVGRTLSAFVRGSYLYRWLTAEPDPDVIVIDLRETWTVGPIIAILDRVVAGIEHAAADSAVVKMGGLAIDRTLDAPIRMAGFVALGVALPIAASAIVSDQLIGLMIALGFAVVGGVAVFETRSWGELRETQPVELLIAAFEPPEPPNSTSSDHAHTADDDEKLKADTGNPKEKPKKSFSSTNANGGDDAGTELAER